MIIIVIILHISAYFQSYPGPVRHLSSCNRGCIGSVAVSGHEERLRPVVPDESVGRTDLCSVLWRTAGTDPTRGM